MRTKILRAAVAMVCLWAATCGATLTAIVSPGYQLSPGEVPTVATLNLLGMPTITISGTVDGTTGLTPGSVNGNLLADSVVDGLTLGYNADNPREMYVIAGGLINTNSALLATNDTLQIFVDPLTLYLGTNSPGYTNENSGSMAQWLTIQSNAVVDALVSPAAAIQPSKIYCPSNMLAAGYWSNSLTPIMYDYRTMTIQPNYTNVVTWTNNIMGTNYVITVTNVGPALVPISYAATYYSVPGSTVTNGWGTVPATNGVCISVPNPFTAPPSLVRWVVVCLTNNNGYWVNEELDARDVYYSGGTPAYSAGADATNAWLTTAAASPYSFQNHTNGAAVTFNPVQWSAKCYLKP
jgi:hypothetical protein